MAGFEHLPKPQLTARHFGARCLPVLTDESLFGATGVRIAFTGREGGVSKPPFDTLNLGDHVDDDSAAVAQNRSLLLEAMGALQVPLVVPKQVHGDVVVTIDEASPSALEGAVRHAQAGADALVVSVPQVAALLCFADCVPVIIVSPRGHFAVVHAGWRGVMKGVAAQAVRALTQGDAAVLGPNAAATYNVYIGPHIHACCFETGQDVYDSFVARFGEACASDNRHISLLRALTTGLVEAGVVRDRIVDAGVCTVCSRDAYFSYRATGGVCGRQGALAVRVDRGDRS